MNPVVISALNEQFQFARYLSLEQLGGEGAVWLENVVVQVMRETLPLYAESKYEHAAAPADLKALDAQTYGENSTYWMNLSEKKGNAWWLEYTVKEMAAENDVIFEKFKSDIQTALFGAENLSAEACVKKIQQVVEAAHPVMMTMVVEHMLTKLGSPDNEAFKKAVIQNVRLLDEDGRIIEAWKGDTDKTQKFLQSMLVDPKHYTPEKDVKAAVYGILALSIRKHLKLDTVNETFLGTIITISNKNKKAMRIVRHEMFKMGLLLNDSHISMKLFMAGDVTESMAGIALHRELALVHRNEISKAQTRAQAAKAREYHHYDEMPQMPANYYGAMAEANRQQLLFEAEQGLRKKLYEGHKKIDGMVEARKELGGLIDANKAKLKEQQSQSNATAKQINKNLEKKDKLNNSNEAMKRQTIAQAFRSYVWLSEGKTIPPQAQELIAKYERGEIQYGDLWNKLEWRNSDWSTAWGDEDGRLSRRLDRCARWFDYMFNGVKGNLSPAEMKKMNKITAAMQAHPGIIGTRLNALIVQYNNRKKEIEAIENKTSELMDEYHKLNNQINETQKNLNLANQQLAKMMNTSPEIAQAMLDYIQSNEELREIFELLQTNPEEGAKRLKALDCDALEADPLIKQAMKDFQVDYLEAKEIVDANTETANKISDIKDYQEAAMLPIILLRAVFTTLNRHGLGGAKAEEFLHLSEDMVTIFSNSAQLFELWKNYKKVGASGLAFANFRAKLDVANLVGFLLTAAFDLVVTLAMWNKAKFSKEQIMEMSIQKMLDNMMANIEFQFDDVKQSIEAVRQEMQGVGGAILFHLDAIEKALSNVSEQLTTTQVARLATHMHDIEGKRVDITDKNIDKAGKYLELVNKANASAVYPNKEEHAGRFAEIPSLAAGFGDLNANGPYSQMVETVAHFPGAVYSGALTRVEPLGLTNTHVLAHQLERIQTMDMPADAQGELTRLYDTTLKANYFGMRVSESDYVLNMADNVSKAYRALHDAHQAATDAQRKVMAEKDPNTVVNQHKSKKEGLSARFNTQLETIFDYKTWMAQKNINEGHVKPIFEKQMAYFRALLADYNALLAFAMEKHPNKIAQVYCADANVLPLIIHNDLSVYVDRLAAEHKLDEKAKAYFKSQSVTYDIETVGDDTVVYLIFNHAAISEVNYTPKESALFKVEYGRFKGKKLESLFGVVGNEYDEATLKNMLVLQMTLGSPELLHNVTELDKGKRASFTAAQDKVVNSLKDSQFLDKSESNSGVLAVQSVNKAHADKKRDKDYLAQDYQHLKNMFNLDAPQEEIDTAIAHFKKLENTERGRKYNYAYLVKHFDNLDTQRREYILEQSGVNVDKKSSGLATFVTELVATMNHPLRKPGPGNREDEINHLEYCLNKLFEAYKKAIARDWNVLKREVEALEEKAFTHVPLVSPSIPLQYQFNVNVGDYQPKGKRTWQDVRGAQLPSRESFGVRMLYPVQGQQETNLNAFIGKVADSQQLILDVQLSQNDSVKLSFNEYVVFYNQLVFLLLHTKDMSVQEAVQLIEEKLKLPFVGRVISQRQNIAPFLRKLDVSHASASPQDFYKAYDDKPVSADYAKIGASLAKLGAMIDIDEDQVLKLKAKIDALFAGETFKNPLMFVEVDLNENELPKFVRQNVPADGDCLYRAVGFYLGESIQVLRQQVANYLIEHKAEFEPAFAGLSIPEQPNLTWDEYLQNISTTKQWADNLVIVALEKIYKRPIVLVNDRTYKPIITDAEQAHSMKDNPIFVVYNGVNHYDALIPFEKQAPALSTKKPTKSFVRSAATQTPAPPQPQAPVGVNDLPANLADDYEPAVCKMM